ncbi:hypothetical protein ACFXEL_31670 [Streptomyces sp. NPDC059382]
MRDSDPALIPLTEAFTQEATSRGVGHLVEIPAPSHRVADVSVAR